MARELYKVHGRALSLLHADIESQAFGQRQAFIGTAGSVIERTNATGFHFYAHQYYDVEGRKRERYVAGPIGEPAADAAAAELRARIAEVNEILPSVRLLAREGYATADPKTY